MAQESNKFTVAQFLAIAPKLPPSVPFSVASTNSTIFDNRPRTAHASSKLNDEYKPIALSTLKPLGSQDIAQFRQFVTSMSPTVTFCYPHDFPSDGCALRTKGDVTAYANTQVIDAAWRAVLQMIPPRDRQYDLLRCWQLPIEGGVPDQVFGILRKKGTSDLELTPCAILELKAPNMVRDLLSIIQNALDGMITDPSPDWVKITQQLRKYAVNSRVNDILLMDDATAIYFAFPPGPTSENEEVYYVVATSGSSVLNEHNFTLRELVAFTCWCALRRSHIPIHNFEDVSLTTVDSGYTSVLTPDVDSGGRKRSRSQQAQPKRARSHQAPQDTTCSVLSWRVDEELTLTISDSEYFEKLHMSPEDKTRRPFRPPPKRASYRVSQVLTESVAVLSLESHSQPPSRIIAKIPYSLDHLDAELAAYDTLFPVQGSLVPHCYGTATTPRGDLVILIEFIESGTTVVELRESGEWDRIANLRETALKAVQRIHGAWSTA